MESLKFEMWADLPGWTTIADGNGRMGRLGQTLIGSRWNSLFGHIPVESRVHEHQIGYHLTIDRVCEDILISSGLYEEAYKQYGLRTNRGGTHLATFRNIAKKYPMMKKTTILEDLIETTPDEPGKWFATAKSLGMLPLAMDLCHRSPCDPRTLNRAARDFQDKEPTLLSLWGRATPIARAEREKA